MITEEQRKERSKYIGGSDLPIILGLSSYKTPYQLYCEKKGIIENTFEETQLQYWGNQLEVLIRKEFRKRNKVKVTTPKETIAHPFYDFLRGNLDGFIPKWNAVFEAKCSHQFMSQHWGESDSDVIPMEYLVQVAFYCSVTNADSAHIAVLIGGNDYRQFKYNRDLELEKTIIDAACGFWDAMQNETPPPAIRPIDLKLMFPKVKIDSSISINNELKPSLEILRETRIKISELEKIESQKKFELMSYMKDNDCLIDADNNALVTWKENKRGSRTFLLKGQNNDS
jgi:putative phage-type endonuclease